MRNKLYRELITRIIAYHNCIAHNNTVWQDNHEGVINQLIDSLPHGSGIDGTTSVDLEKSGEKGIIIYSSFHAMNDNGMYDGWIDFTLTVKPSLSSDFTLDIRGNFGKYQDIKEYLADIFSSSFSEYVYIEFDKATGNTSVYLESYYRKPRIIDAFTGKGLHYPHNEDIAEKLQDINTAYGKGEIKTVLFTSPFTGWIIRTLQYGEDSRQFRIKKKDPSSPVVLHFLGRERVLKG